MEQVEYQCEYSEIEISWTMMLFISIIISAFNSVVGWFFDVLFQILLSPLPDSHIKKAAPEVAATTDSAAPKTGRHMGAVLKSHAKKLMLINKLKVCELTPVFITHLTHSSTDSFIH